MGGSQTLSGEKWLDLCIGNVEVGFSGEVAITVGPQNLGDWKCFLVEAQSKTEVRIQILVVGGRDSHAELSPKILEEVMFEFGSSPKAVVWNGGRVRSVARCPDQ